MKTLSIVPRSEGSHSAVSLAHVQQVFLVSSTATGSGIFILVRHRSALDSRSTARPLLCRTLPEHEAGT